MGPATIGRSLRSLAFKTFAYSLFFSKIDSDMKADLLIANLINLFPT